MPNQREELVALRTRVEQLEQEVKQLLAATAVARPLLEDAGRIADLADEARAASELTAAAVDTVRSLTALAGVAQPRVQADLNVVYQAKTVGYVSVSFVSGWTDNIDILVGTTDPPTESVGQCNTRSGENTYAGTIVRPGEYWMAQAQRRSNAGFICRFTPLF